MQVITIVLSTGASVISGMALFYLQRFFAKKDREEKEIQKAKAKENILILKSINAVGKLTEANAIALRDGKTNGELKQAMDAHEEIEKEMFEYLLKENSKKMI